MGIGHKKVSSQKIHFLPHFEPKNGHFGPKNGHFGHRNGHFDFKMSIYNSYSFIWIYIGLVVGLSKHGNGHLGPKNDLFANQNVHFLSTFMPKMVIFRPKMAILMP